ncbi:MAG: Na+/H+ antiporter subunit E [Acidimicrobiia bacterium]|nr:Na+/H+ antiporter subunit E [Acidimicrobiia bacterium]
MSDGTRPSMRIPLVVLWLTILWVTLWADISIGNVVGGILVGLVVALVAKPPGNVPAQRASFRPLHVLVYGLYFLYQLVASSLVVAWEILTPGSGLYRAIIAMQMHTTEEGLITLVANSITLTPGTAIVDLHESADGAPPTIYIHVLHSRDVESVRRDVLRLERLAIKAFGSRQAIAAVDEAMEQLSTEGSADR